MQSTRNGRPVVGKSSFKRRRVHQAVILALGPVLAMQAGAQAYTSYDGSKTSDLKAAVASWAGNVEFQKDWGAGGMNAQYAYALGYSGAGVKIGAVDSGIQTTHQEFKGRGTVVPVTIEGQYLYSGGQQGLTWQAGDKFLVSGDYHPSANKDQGIAANNYHGQLVSGTIAAAKNGQGTMGMAFGSQFFTTNTNGTDGLLFNKDRDYNYFYEAYGALAQKGVRVINSSWGSQDSAEDYSTPGKLAASYALLQSVDPATGASTRKSWLDAAVDVTKKTGVIQVFSAGNTGYANASVRGSLPYFRPEMEANWLTVTGLDKDESHLYNSCGVAKYWCIGGPTNTQSTDLDNKYSNFNGTSAAAPHVTGALGILMERYPSLGNAEIRTILLTTARQPKTLDAATGDAVTTVVPDAVFGWGVPDLKKGMNGPGQFLGVFNAKLSAGMSDTWSNSISETALIQRKKEETAEIAAWSGTRADLMSQVKPVPESSSPSNELVTGIAQGKALLQAAITANTRGVYTPAKLKAALDAVNADPVGKQLLQLYESYKPGWTGPYSETTDFDGFVAGRSDLALAKDVVTGQRVAVIAGNAAIQNQITYGQSRVTYLQGKTDADYVGSLLKTGSGTLTLTGDNSYSGGTQLQEGTLGVGSSTALGTGLLAMSDATTLQAAADKLTLANAITVSGIGNIDTQAFGLTLSGAITDGSTPGGFAKLGAGTLTLSGANTYSGPTGVINGTLRAGSATAFSARSTFFVDTQGQLDLGGINQSIGSLFGAGKVALGTATLTTGADNSSTVFSGQIDGSGGLTKTGSGTFTLAGANASPEGVALKAGPSGAGANTYSGATLVAAGTLQAGAANTFSAASAVTVNTGATLNLAGYDQRIAGMNLAGTVSLAGAAPGTTLTVTGPWTGNGGLLKLGTVSPTVSDRVLLSGTNAVASGTTTVQIGNFAGLGGATVGSGIELIGTTGGASIQGNAFALAGGHVDSGAYEYRLNNLDKGSYLSASTALGQTYYRSEVPQFAALPAQLRQASLAMLGNMHQRTGDDEVKSASGKPSDGTDSAPHRSWGRTLTTNLDIRQGGTVSPESHGRLDGFQAGTDLLSIRNWRAGVYVGQLDGDMGVSGFARGIQGLRTGSNNLRNQYLGAYGTYTSDGGFYADAVLQSGRHRYDLTSPLTQTGSGGSGKGRSLLASIEVGQPFALGGAGSWTVEPQLQLIHQRLNLDDVTLTGSTVVRQRPDSAWLARLGVRVKGEVGVGGARLQPYARFNLYRASNGNDVASFIAPGGRTAIASSTGGTSAELAAGATLALTPTFGLYGEIGKLWSAGGDTRVKSSVQGGVGARILW